MNNFITEVWKKTITEHLEKTNEFLERLNQERLKEETAAMNKRILEAREQIENMTTEKLAEILVAFEFKLDEQEKTIKNLKESVESLDKIKDIICTEYGLEEY